MPKEPATQSAAAKSTGDDPLGAKAVLQAVVQKLQSQILLFGLGAIVVLVAAGSLGGPQTALIVGAVLFVVVLVVIVYVFAETKKELAAGAAPAAPEKTAAPEKQAASAELDAIANPAPAFEVELWTAAKSAAATRDVGTVSKKNAKYRVGEKIAVSIRASRRCYLTLLNIGTSGKLTVLYPNTLHRDNVLEAGKEVRIPGEGDGFEWEILGPPGVERLKAVATLESLALLESSFAPDGSLFRTAPATAATRDIAIVKKNVDALPKTQWAEATCRFEVVG